VIGLAQQIRIQSPSVKTAIFQTLRSILHSDVQTKLQPCYRHGFSGRDSEHGKCREKFDTTEETVHTFPDNDDAPCVALVEETAQYVNLKQIHFTSNKNFALITGSHHKHGSIRNATII
jgi:hemerythrin-like domain-containing protein